jgi:F0F1-type ATP synthase assembly protein I
MEYCPKCGAPLKSARVYREAYEKYEKHEKQEKAEKAEKTEKHEKGEASRFWALIAGLIIIVLGATSLMATLFNIDSGPFFLIIVGILIIIFAIYGATRATRRSPRP